MNLIFGTLCTQYVYTGWAKEQARTWLSRALSLSFGKAHKVHETTTFLLITFTKYSPFLTYRAQYRRTDGQTDGSQRRLMPRPTV